ncbi:MAG: effector-binding domain-containing protein [Methylophagaceae bacterium]|jgi:effector-binding domain-containing protein
MLNNSIRAALITILISGQAVAIEEAQYEVISKQNNIEVRHYVPHVLAETIVNDNIEDAGNAAFQPLFEYISGDNTAKIDITMTAPISRQAASEKIAMTAPVSQQKANNGWAISFMMPAYYTLATLPKPNNPRVELRQVPERVVASIRYSGFWSKENYSKHKQELESWIQQSNHQINGEAIWARYNAPFTPWFLRRNEVLIPITDIRTQ